jgi:hypothetical protein
MDYRSILDRILQTVDEEAYVTPLRRIGGEEGLAVGLVRESMRQQGWDPEQVRSLIQRLESEGRMRRVTALSALHIVAAHPKVANWAEAARLAGEQELAALEEGGPDLNHNLASVDRHRGVIAFQRGFYENALDNFGRALERERSAANLGNILSTLIRLREETEARSLLIQIRASYPPALVEELDTYIQQDHDLALLRTENAP